MRAAVRSFDRWLARSYGIFEFSQRPECILRLQQARSRRDVLLPDASLRAGEPVLGLHLWNDRIPALPETGPDLAWAARTWRLYTQSLHLAAAYIRDQPDLSGLRALVGVTSLFDPSQRAGENHPMANMGFVVLPYHSPLGSFGDFWENFYAWWVMWAYNPLSARGRSLLSLRRSEMWISMPAFLHRYGTANEILRQK